jgi:hypothetical protein
MAGAIAEGSGSEKHFLSAFRIPFRNQVDGGDLDRSASHIRSKSGPFERDDAENQHSGIPVRGTAPSAAAHRAGRRHGAGRARWVPARCGFLDGARWACNPRRRFSARSALPEADDGAIRKLAPPPLAQRRPAHGLWQPEAGAPELSCAHDRPPGRAMQGARRLHAGRPSVHGRQRERGSPTPAALASRVSP